MHAQYTFLSHPRGWACDCWHFERCRHADQRGGHERSGRLLIVFRADEMEEMAAGAHEMLPRIRHRPLQLSLVSALTRSLGCSGRHRPSPTKGHGLRPPIASCCWHGHVARHPLPEPPDKTYGTESAGEKRKGGGQWCLSYLEDADSREGTGGAEFTPIIAGAIASVNTLMSPMRATNSEKPLLPKRNG